MNDYCCSIPNFNSLYTCHGCIVPILFLFNVVFVHVSLEIAYDVCVIELQLRSSNDLIILPGFSIDNFFTFVRRFCISCTEICLKTNKPSVLLLLLLLFIHSNKLRMIIIERTSNPIGMDVIVVINDYFNCVK